MGASCCFGPAPPTDSMSRRPESPSPCSAVSQRDISQSSPQPQSGYIIASTSNYSHPNRRHSQQQPNNNNNLYSSKSAAATAAASTVTSSRRSKPRHRSKRQSESPRSQQQQQQQQQQKLNINKSKTKSDNDKKTSTTKDGKRNSKQQAKSIENDCRIVLSQSANCRNQNQPHKSAKISKKVTNAPTSEPTATTTAAAAAAATKTTKTTKATKATTKALSNLQEVKASGNTAIKKGNNNSINNNNKTLRESDTLKTLFEDDTRNKPDAAAAAGRHLKIASVTEAPTITTSLFSGDRSTSLHLPSSTLLLANASSPSTSITSHKSLTQLREEMRFVDRDPASPLLTTLLNAYALLAKLKPTVTKSSASPASSAAPSTITTVTAKSSSKPHQKARKAIESALESTRLNRDQALTNSPGTGSEITALTLSVSDLMTRRWRSKQRAASSSLPAEHRTIIEPPFSNLDEIVPHVFLTGMYGLMRESFREIRFRLVINATTEYPMIRAASSADMWSFRVPVEDSECENIETYFDDIADLIEANRRAARPSVIHCAAGVSRSATLVLAYLLKYTNFSLRDAFAYVYALRPCVRPNMAFFRSLTDYERRWQGVSYFTGTIMVEVSDPTIAPGVVVRVPDFYPDDYPQLYRKVIEKYATMVPAAAAADASVATAVEKSISASSANNLTTKTFGSGNTTTTNLSTNFGNNNTNQKTVIPSSPKKKNGTIKPTNK